MRNGTSGGIEERVVDPLPDQQLNNGGDLNGVTPEVALSTAQKRKRRPSAVEIHRNGDLMDIDEGAIVQSRRTDSVQPLSRSESPAVEELPLLSTLSIGRSTGVQSEKTQEFPIQSAILKIDDPGVTVLHTMWSPTDPPRLLTAGRSLLRLYAVPSTLPSDSIIPQFTFDGAKSVADSATITSLCWASLGNIVAATFDDRSLENESGMPGGNVHLVSYLGEETRLISSLPEIVFALRWNSSSKMLLGISSNDVRGCIWLWDTAKVEIICSEYTDQPITDAIWLNETVFAVCGHEFLQIYEYDERLLHCKKHSTATRWEKLRYDPASGHIACLSLEENVFGIATPESVEIKSSPPQSNNLTALEFQPVPDRSTYNSDSPRILATAYDNGTIQLWDAKRPFESIRRLNMDVPVMAMAFSPDGSLLAGAGDDTVMLWNAEVGGLPKAIWRGAEGQWPSHIEEAEEEEAGEGDHILAWDFEGKKLAFMFANHVNSIF